MRTRMGRLASDLRLLVVTNMWPTATRPYLGIFIARQVEGLRDAGVHVDVVAIDGERPGDYRRAARRMLALNRGPRRYHLIHAHTGHSGVLACLQLRYPVVMSYAGYDLDVRLGDAETLRRTVERFVFRWLSLLIAASIAKSARGARHLPPGGKQRNFVVTNGVDRDLFRPRPRADARAALGWDHDDPVVLFAADPLRWEKRFALCEAAVVVARSTVPELRLEVAAQVPPDEMALWYCAADTLLLTSTQEHSPNVVKEAMACDLPVVSVDVGDVPEVVDEAQLCRVCKPEPSVLAAGIVDVVRASPVRSDGRQKTEWLSLPAISARLLEVYLRAVERGAGPLGFLPYRLRSPSIRDGAPGLDAP